MSADWTIGICDRDRTLKDRLKGLPDIKPLGLAADQHRHRLELARDLARRLGCRGPGGLRRGCGFARSLTASSFGCSSALAASHCTCSSAIRAAACALAPSACCFASAEIAEPSVVSAAAKWA